MARVPGPGEQRASPETRLLGSRDAPRVAAKPTCRPDLVAGNRGRRPGSLSLRDKGQRAVPRTRLQPAQAAADCVDFEDEADLKLTPGLPHGEFSVSERADNFSRFMLSAP